MRRIVWLTCVSLLFVGIALAQNGAAPPPSDYGIGNTATSPNSNVGNSPSFSPDQNQAITGTRGTTTGDNHSPNNNPAYAGAGQDHSTANSTGATKAKDSTQSHASPAAQTQSSRGGKRKSAKGGGAKSDATGNGSSHAAETKGNAITFGGGPSQVNGNTVTSPVYPTGGPSTTEAPGPATDTKGNKHVPRGGNGNYSGTSSQSSGPGH